MCCHCWGFDPVLTFLGGGGMALPMSLHHFLATAHVQVMVMNWHEGLDLLLPPQSGANTL
eukprot:4007255-Amphidinium_carterae.1